MQFPNQNWVAPIYFILLVIVIAAGGNDLFWAAAIAKGLLMPLLMVYFWLNVRPRTDAFVRFMLVALGFSWLGDLLMLFQDQAIFFVLGLGSFLAAHIAYIGVFTRKQEGKKTVGLVGRNFLWAAPIMIYGFGLYLWLYPSLNGMMVPVCLYAVAICGMLIAAVNRQTFVSYLSFRYVLLGALLFVVSDSMIALNMFDEPINNASFWIMMTYGLGQWLIVTGVLWFNKN